MFWGSLLLVFCPIVFVQPIRYYLLTFLLGIYFRNGLMFNILPPPLRKLYNKCTNKQLSRWEYFALLIVLFVSIPLRMIIPYALAFDTAIIILLVIVYHNMRYRSIVADKSLSFLGKHSFNIFLFHTFIYYLYLPQLIYWHRNPIIIFLTLLLFSITISYVIEYSKDKLGYYSLLKHFENF